MEYKIKRPKKRHYEWQIGTLILILCYVKFFQRSLYVFYNKEHLLDMVMVILIVFFVLMRLPAFLKKKRFLRSDLTKVDQMSGIQFEEYLAVHFRRLGYKVSLTDFSGDYGADLLMKKKQYLIVVQAKRYSGSVGVKAVQEVIGALSYYGADYGMVVTNSHFTENAKILAQRSGIELWDREVMRQRFFGK